MEKKKLVILFSGGSDSVVLVEIAKELKIEDIYCVLVDYGQKHIEELEVGKKYLQEKNIDYQVIEIKNLSIRSALTSKEKNLYEGVSEWNVPGRNTFLLGLAISVAESKNYNTIWYGADYSDRLGLFPDCYQEYVVLINKISEYTTLGKIKIEAPLIGLTKETIISILESKKIPTTKYFSGYGNL